jgi:hypothetical protein
MDELIKLVSQNANIPEENAKAAVDTVLGFLTDKLPAPIASQIDGLVSNPDLGKQVGGALGGLGGLLGRK